VGGRKDGRFFEGILINQLKMKENKVSGKFHNLWTLLKESSF
jgi:hypothetical protein